MIEFYSQVVNGAPQIVGTYSFTLVATSCLVATISAYAGLRLARYAGYKTSSTPFWLGLGGLTMGIGVWAMHFIGMLAFQLPIPIAYNLILTIVSMAPGILGSTLALAFLHKAETSGKHAQKLIAGVALGLGTGAMHYTGMMAMQLDAAMYFDKKWFLLSILIAVVLGVVGVYAERLRRYEMPVSWLSSPLKFTSAVVLGLAVVGMHYAAMQATIFIPSPQVDLSGELILSPPGLAIDVSVVSVLIAGMAIIAAQVDDKIKSAHHLEQVSRERMMSAIESLQEGFLLFDEEGQLVLRNRVFLEMYPELEDVAVLGATYESVLRAWSSKRDSFPDGMDRESYIQSCLTAFRDKTPMNGAADEYKLPDGRWTVIKQHAIGVGGLVGVWTDVTAIKHREDKFKELALRDTLTNLPNRSAFDQHLSAALKRAKRTKSRLALMFIDLDKFKPINDTYGHDAGDHVLKIIAKRLSDGLRETDFVARIGGDEFVAVLENTDTVATVADKILKEIKQPIEFKGDEFHVGSSIGIGIFPDNADDEEKLIKAADKAMYEVKEGGRNNYRVYGIA